MEGQGQPYFFDAHFFEDDLPDSEDRPQEPEFTRDELEAEKAKAFENGKKAGFQESETGLTQQTLNTLKKVERDYSVLIAAERDRIENYEADAIALCLSVMRKVFPAYNQKHGLDEIKHALTQSLSSHNTPECIVIEVHNDVLAEIEGHTKDLEQSLHKNITLRANPTLETGQCHVNWPDGGIISNRQKIAEQTIGLIKDALAEHGINSHDESSLDDALLSKEMPDNEAVGDMQVATDTETGETS